MEVPPAALAAIGDPGLRATLLAVRGRRRAAGIDEVAAATGVHRNVARRRLERLVAAGLLTARFERPSGRRGPGAGRPAKLYSPAPETTAIEFPQRRYGELVSLLAGEVSQRRLAEVGVRFGSALADAGGVEPAGDLRAGLERLCDAVGSLGFQARVESAGGDGAVILTPTCPLRPLIVSDPSLASLDQGLWRGLVTAAVDDVRAGDVGCEAHDCLEPFRPCRIVVSLRPSGRDAGGAGQC
jgi:predicted ArsR family transcriptional regulator